MSKKIQEVVVGLTGHLLNLSKNYQLSATYTNSNVSEEMIVEWHDLIDAVGEWEQEASNDLYVEKKAVML